MDQLVQNVPDLGHIPILHTDQKHCNEWLDIIMPDIGQVWLDYNLSPNSESLNTWNSNLPEIGHIFVALAKTNVNKLCYDWFIFLMSLLLFPVRDVIRVPKPRARRLWILLNAEVWKHFWFPKYDVSCVRTCRHTWQRKGTEYAHTTSYLARNKNEKKQLCPNLRSQLLLQYKY